MILNYQIQQMGVWKYHKYHVGEADNTHDTKPETKTKILIYVE